MENITLGGDKISFKFTDKYYCRLSIRKESILLHESLCNIDSSFVNNVRQILEGKQSNFFIKTNYRGKDIPIYFTYVNNNLKVTFIKLNNKSDSVEFNINKDDLTSLEKFLV